MFAPCGGMQTSRRTVAIGSLRSPSASILSHFSMIDRTAVFAGRLVTSPFCVKTPHVRSNTSTARFFTFGAQEVIQP